MNRKEFMANRAHEKVREEECTMLADIQKRYHLLGEKESDFIDQVTDILADPMGGLSHRQSQWLIDIWDEVTDQCPSA